MPNNNPTGRDTPDYRAALNDALWSDHPSTDLHGDDIAMARAQGYVYSAAHLLMGATETPNVDRVVAAYGGLPRARDGWPIDFDAWVAWFRANTWNCDGCNGYTHTDSLVCGNCLLAR